MRMYSLRGDNKQKAQEAHEGIKPQKSLQKQEIGEDAGAKPPSNLLESYVPGPQGTEHRQKGHPTPVHCLGEERDMSESQKAQKRGNHYCYYE